MEILKVFSQKTKAFLLINYNRIIFKIRFSCEELLSFLPACLAEEIVGKLIFSDKSKIHDDLQF